MAKVVMEKYFQREKNLIWQTVLVNSIKTDLQTYNLQTVRQSHFREVPQWEIFTEQELRFGLDLGRL